MGARRSVWDKQKARARTRHVWVWPKPNSLEPVQGLVIDWIRRGDEEWARVVFMSAESPPTVVDTFLPSRVLRPVASQPDEPDY